MKMRYRMILILLSLCAVLSACGADPAEETIATAAPTVPTEAATEAPTEPPTEPPTEAPTEPPIDETVLPTGDEATGTLHFYIGDKTIYAGGPVADILDAGIQTYDDFSQIIQPWHMSEQVKVRVEDESLEVTERPYVFLIAVNASHEPKPLSECLIYSVTVNYGGGIKFGSGNEEEPFVTGKTKRSALEEAYGEPDYAMKATSYQEIAYFEPFNGVIFTIQSKKVTQVTTYYAANIYGELAESYGYDAADGYFGLDCAVLMSQYLDVAPYLSGEEVETGTLEKISEEITLGGQKIEFGVRCIDMPDPFGEPFEDLKMPLGTLCYIRTGRVNKEEFFLINKGGQGGKGLANELKVKGVITENRNYQNWGTNNQEFNEFEFEGLTQDATITEILEKYGQPQELQLHSTGKSCFAWMHYVDEGGNTLRFRVDPMLNQLIEIRVTKFYQGEYTY